MADLATELLHWAPPSILAIASTGLGGFILKQFGRHWERLDSAVGRLDKSSEKIDEIGGRLGKLEEQVAGLRAEMQARVSVADHRESVRALWDESRKTTERLAQIETEMRVRQDLSRKRGRS